MTHLHAFSGNDYIGSFLRKGKSAFWKLMRVNEEFQEIFTELGRENRASAYLLLGLQIFVCNLNGKRRLLSEICPKNGRYREQEGNGMQEARVAGYMY